MYYILNYKQIKMNLIYLSSLVLLLTLTNVPSTQARAKNTNNSTLTVSTHDLVVVKNRNKTFDVLPKNDLEQDISVTLISQHKGLVLLDPINFIIKSSADVKYQTINVFGLSPGQLEVTAVSEPDEAWSIADVLLRITIANSEALVYISIVFGWIYFSAWSISFYPQIYTNFRRKSVVGLNFDFLTLNIVGHSLYFVFNIGMYWIPAIQTEYQNRYPRGMNPVLLNDVVFSMHAVFATAITILQCFIYEHGDQRLSKTASAILIFFALFLAASMGLSIGNVIYWLDFLYYCSYVKLAITIIKYVPQALMNYRRKSTVGWSIGNIILDFTGGILSMLQMILNAYNYDDWSSLFGDPTKFGLGLFSVAFDIFFMLQHFVFYRHSKYVSDSNITGETEVKTSKTNLESSDPVLSSVFFIHTF